jgi:hypothetical protein
MYVYTEFCSKENKMKALPSIEILKSMFVYDPETGFIYKKMGSARDDGYVYLYVDGKQYAAHRIIWKLHTGEDPIEVIDHINGDKSDNRIVNLRDVSHLENARNRNDCREKNRIKALEHIEKWRLKRMKSSKND